MADTKEVLEMMKDVAKSRIEMLRQGITFHDDDKRKIYLKEYEEKLKDIETLLRRLNIRLVHSKDTQQEADATE